MLIFVRQRKDEDTRRRLLWSLRSALVSHVCKPDIMVEMSGGETRIKRKRPLFERDKPTMVHFVEDNLEMPVCAFLLGGRYSMLPRWKKPPVKAKPTTDSYMDAWFEELNEFEQEKETHK